MDILSHFPSLWHSVTFVSVGHVHLSPVCDPCQPHSPGLLSIQVEKPQGFFLFLFTLISALLGACVHFALEAEVPANIHLSTFCHRLSSALQGCGRTSPCSRGIWETLHSKSLGWVTARD